MPNSNVKTNWVGGDLYFYDKAATEICHIDGTNGQISVPTGKLVVNGSAVVGTAASEVTFTETTGAGTYTGAVTIPADATIIDIQVRSTAVWTATTSALMDVGDAGVANGWYTQINLKVTDLLVGEVIKFDKSGGKEGAYLVQSSGLENQSYSASQRVITGSIVTVGAAGSAGRTRMLVLYIAPSVAAASKA